MHVKQCVLQVHQPGIGGVRDRLCGSARLGGGGFVTGERVAMDKGMPRGSAFDLAQPNKITSFEIAIPMFEFPQRRVRRSCVKYIAH